MRFYRNVFRLSYACHAFLSECLACGSYLSCVPLGMSCVRFALVLRFWRGVLCSIYARRAFLLECLVFVHACCLTRCVKQNGLREAAFLFRRRSGSPVARSQWPCGYRTLRVHFGLVRFLAAIPTENEGDGERSRRRGVRAFLRDYIGFVMISAGSPLGQNVEAALRPRPKTCAKESNVEAALRPLWTLFIGFAAKCLFVKPRNDRYP